MAVRCSARWRHARPQLRGALASGSSVAVKPASIAEVAEYFEGRRSHRNGQQSGKGVHEEGGASDTEPDADKPQVH